MVTKELCTEIERLGKTLGMSEIGDRLGFSKYKVRGLIKKYEIPYEKKTPTSCVRRRLTRKIFERRVKRQYATSNVWIPAYPRYDGALVLVMSKGKVLEPKWAVEWWKEKIDKAWKRRDRFPVGSGGEE